LLPLPSVNVPDQGNTYKYAKCFDKGERSHLLKEQVI
jgi:hypothetical protein